MRTVAIEEFKDHVEDYLSAARKGEGLLITSRGEPVAELRSPSVGREIPEGLHELARRGTARELVSNDPSRYRTYEKALSGTTAQELIDLGRGER